MDFKPVIKSRLYEDVVNQIKDLIRSGKVKPGDKFPPERKLAKQLGVSRGTLREAFRVLEVRGIVESKRGGGRYLKDFTGQNIYQSDDSLLDLEKDAILKIAEARKLIETQIVKKAVQEATEEDIARMEQILKFMQTATKEEYLESNFDLDFHLAIAKATHNFALYDLLEAQIQLLIELQQKYILSHSWRKELCKDHESILAAIMERDEQAAEMEMEKHIDHLIEKIQKS
ncbi:FadR/GntR family transcriptional regulator [Fuchsiella alkaliacetigena]|uniref:FadR/GntR family transcriptional regulator n=1 Tax=Fuchsiella alkaliacetigena TaxID=957042 RepID=UPI00200B1DA6|nr:FadR/GntR family transcriptional regulator [Fuchsiella alkaliacetigena]MCK8825377.1 FadR family transcriptional regulator [Fuchsiella alkaliacetigena]